MSRIFLVSCLSLLLFPGLVQAKSRDEDTRWVLASVEDKPCNVSVTIRQEADVLTLPIKLTSDNTVLDRRLGDLDTASGRFLAKVKGDSNVELFEGHVVESAGFAASVPNFDLGIELKAASEGKATNTVTADVTYFLALSSRFKGKTPIERAEGLAAFADNLLFGMVDTEAGRVRLAVAEPEEYRVKLIGKISEQVANLKKALGPETVVHVQGLEGPVRVRQLNYKMVEFYLDYKIQMEQWNMSSMPPAPAL